MFKLPREVKDGIKDYKNSLEDLISGKINPARFVGVRVPWGTYSHRGGKVFMSRLRIPAGQVNSEQLKAISYVAQTFGRGMAHITTRQDIQIHDVKLEDTIKIIEYLKEYDLSPRGGGGNTVRNVTACALSGICKDEVFDVRGHAISLTEYLLRFESSFTLPRKFKICFSSCGKDCAGVLVNDAGLLSREKNGSKGFQLFVGGGMGYEPMLGHLLEEFVSEDEFGYNIRAVINVFNKNGDRRNKHHNRLRFLIKDMGFDNFKKLYLEELKLLKENEYISLRNIEVLETAPVNEEIPEVDDEDFKRFVEYNVHSQKQNGLASVELRIPRGDIAAKNLKELAALEEGFPGIEFRTSQNQNIFLCNIKKSSLHELYLKIKDALSDFLYPSTLLDVVCCKGALTCNLGLCNSPGLTEEVEKIIKENFTTAAIFRKLNIKINGCPNSCGHHPIGLIALHGVARRVDGRPVPFYKLLLGGRKAATHTRLSQDTGILIPAKNVPLFLKSFIERISKNTDANTDIYAYMDKKARISAEEVARKYSYVPAFLENRDFYVDWGRTEVFSLEGLGPGECGKGVLDMIEADLVDAKMSLENAQKNNFSIQEMQRALFFAARSLLVVKGSDPRTEEAAFRAFTDKFIRQNIVRPEFSNVSEEYNAMKGNLNIKEREDKFLYARKFYEHITQLYKSMDSSLNFPRQKANEEVSLEKEVSVLDLKGVRCPMNYVQAKLYMENIERGQIIEICLDEGEPIQNVPVSLKNDGQEILEIKKLDGYYKMRVRKLV